MFIVIANPVGGCCGCVKRSPSRKTWVKWLKYTTIREQLLNLRIGHANLAATIIFLQQVLF